MGGDLFSNLTMNTRRKHQPGSNPGKETEDEVLFTKLKKPETIQIYLKFLILAAECVLGFSSRVFPIIDYGSIIHEFDPWFNYRATAYLVQHGFYSFLNWFDALVWHPLGRNIGATVYPGLMVTSGTLHYISQFLNIPVHIMDICVFIGPIFSGFTVLATYLLTQEVWSSQAGLLAACLIAVVPGLTSRSVAGSYDNEAIAIFALIYTYYLWVKSIKTGSVFWASVTSLSYFYMVAAWGGYVFIINLIPLHVFVLILMGRFSNKLYVSYTVFFIMGLILSMQIPFVGFKAVQSSEHIASLGIFVFVNGVAVLRHLRSEAQRIFQVRISILTIVFTITVVAAFFLAGLTLLSYSGVIAPWGGRLYSLWNNEAVKVLVKSVAEHQRASWGSFVAHLHVLAFTFPFGLALFIMTYNDERVFIILYAVSAAFFARQMGRLMIILTPVACIIGAVAFSRLLDWCLKKSEQHSDDHKGKNNKKGAVKQSQTSKTQQIKNAFGVSARIVAVVAVVMTLYTFLEHSTTVTSTYYSSPNIIMKATYSDGSHKLIDDYREAFYWLSQNTKGDSKIMSWWDYGYQITGMGNRSTIVDNNTWNNTHIALVGKALASNETEAFKIVTALDADYVVVMFGSVLGLGGDINKFGWMLRIAEGEFPDDIQARKYYDTQNKLRIDSTAPKEMLNSLMYKLSYHHFGDGQLDYRLPAGYDPSHGDMIHRESTQLTLFEEVYTTEHWLFRIYRVKKANELGRTYHA